MTKNSWFVANDNGEVAGHDMSEGNAKSLAYDLRQKRTYFIEYYGTSGTGYVGYDGCPCNSIDMAMTFETEEEATEKMNKLQKEWGSELIVAYITDETWEAFNDED